MVYNMMCAICQETMNEPVTALCGAHNFCKACLSAHIQASLNTQMYHYYYGGGEPTVSCPSCRVSIQTSPSQLHVNIALRDMIASASASASASAPVSASPSVPKAAPPPINMTAHRFRDNDGSSKIHVQLLAPTSAEDSTMPILVIPVIDNSGSMGNSSVDATQAGTDAAAFSRSDLVQHAVRTQVELLRNEDEMALVLFDNSATVALEPTQMTPAGRTAAKAQLTKIGPNGGTSIWAGLQKALMIAARPSSAEKNIVIILQTDGESDPSLSPPRGIPAAFKAWLDAHPTVKITLHTIGYGFGAALDMALLRELARIGAGTANYVPDGSMVGTVFIHLLANLMTCQYRGVKLQVPSHGVCIPVGYLQAGALRQFVIDLGVDPIGAEVTVTADNTDTILTVPVFQPSWAAPAWPRAKERLCADLRAALTLGATFDLAPTIAFLRSLLEEEKIRAVLKDLTAPEKYEGQMGKAFASKAAYDRWGQHYMSGVLCGLENEWPINFKDATSAAFGAPATRQLIDRGDEIFNALPPLRASCIPHSGGAAPTSLASTNNSSGPCFLGASRLKMADDTEKRCDEVVAGDLVAGGYRIKCCIHTRLHTGRSEIVRLEGALRPEGHVSLAESGGFTRYHPVYVGDSWQLPESVGEVENIEAEMIYNFVLESGPVTDQLSGTVPGVIIVNGIMTPTMGHDMAGPVIGHPYFGPTMEDRAAGNHNILDDLAASPGWINGLVIWDTATLRNVNNPVTGLICAMVCI